MRKIGLSLAFVTALCAAGADAQNPVPQPPQPLDRMVTLEVRNAPLARVIESIDEQAELSLAYSDQILPKDKLVTLNVRNVTARQALAAALAGTGVSLRVSSSGVLILTSEAEVRSSAGPAAAAAGIVIGVVTDSATGDPIPNAIVSVKGTAIRTATTEHGLYQLREVPSGLHVVMTRLLGYRPLEKEVTVTDDRHARVDFALSHTPSRLQEVVMTATGPRRRLELGNDITVLNADSIVATQPVSSVTDLLENRVPGLAVQRSSGAPGDPARLRLRGVSSPRLSNDPIVVVDGVRVYAEQSNVRGGNLAGFGGTAAYDAPSPLDYIDPNSIETIEVLKGPSAATLYGQDAANGVIVITTKKGRAGPPRWTVSAERGMSEMAGSYPDLLLRWGHLPGNDTPITCPIRRPFPSLPSCVADSVVSFQLLSDPELTVLDKGSRTGVTLGVSGGSDAMTYSLTGSLRDDVGLVKLPGYEVARYREERGTDPPDWMLRPQALTQWGGSSRLTMQLGTKADVSLSANLSRTEQQRSELERQLGTLMGTYLDRASGTYYRSQGTFRPEIELVDEALSDYHQRARAMATQFTTGTTLNWRPLSWLSTTADAGLNVIHRADQVFLPSGARGATADGMLGMGQGSSVMSTVNVRAHAIAPLGRGFNLQFATGVNYTGQAINDLAGQATGLAEGTESLNQALFINTLRESRADQATFGWYVEPMINHKRVWLSTGMRIDGGSTYGTRVKLPTFPKLSLSYLVSDEPFFPFKNLFSALRLRLAYGHAGVQPGPADRLRLYAATHPVFVFGRIADAVELEKLGNTQLQPERSREFEGGFDADLLGDRLSLSMTGYRKMRVNALIEVPVPPSVYTTSVLRNVGAIRNTGVEMSLGAQLVRSDPLTLGTQVSFSQNRNVVVELGRGVQPFYTNTSDGQRVAAGYPLFGRWQRPILGYSDVNGDGVLQPEEVLVGDTAVYVGQTLPNYSANLTTTASFFRGALAVSAGLAYQDGLSQFNQVAKDLLAFSRGVNDENASFQDQATMAALNATPFGLIQTVSTLRFNSLAVTYNVAPRLAERFFRARALSVALQGTNLGLRTNYHGLDPNVTQRATGNSVVDTGVLPQPRTWQLRVRASY